MARQAKQGPGCGEEPHAGLGDAEPGGAVDAAMELAERIARNAPLSLAASKRVLRESWGMTDEAFWPYQQPVLREVFASSDAIEGATAFAEKRSPNWQGT